MASALFAKKKANPSSIRAASPPTSTRRRGATMSTSRLLRTFSTPALFGPSDSSEDSDAPEKFAKKSLSLRTLKLLSEHQNCMVEIEKKVKELKEVMESTMSVLENLGEAEEESSQATDAGWTRQAVFEMQSVQRSTLAALSQEVTSIRSLNGRIVQFTTKCKAGAAPVAPITKKRGSRMRSMTTSAGGLPKPNLDDVPSGDKSGGLPRPPSAPSGGGSGLPTLPALGRTYSDEYTSSSTEPGLSRAKTLPAAAIAGGMRLPPPLPTASKADGKRYQALWDYAGGQRKNDLSFSKGNILVESERKGEWVFGWVEGREAVKGWFPANYSKPL